MEKIISNDKLYEEFKNLKTFNEIFKYIQNFDKTITPDKLEKTVSEIEKLIIKNNILKLTDGELEDVLGGEIKNLGSKIMASSLAALTILTGTPGIAKSDQVSSAALQTSAISEKKINESEKNSYLKAAKKYFEKTKKFVKSHVWQTAASATGAAALLLAAGFIKKIYDDNYYTNYIIDSPPDVENTNPAIKYIDTERIPPDAYVGVIVCEDRNTQKDRLNQEELYRKLSFTGIPPTHDPAKAIVDAWRINQLDCETPRHQLVFRLIRKNGSTTDDVYTIQLQNQKTFFLSSEGKKPEESLKEAIKLYTNNNNTPYEILPGTHKLWFKPLSDKSNHLSRICEFNIVKFKYPTNSEFSKQSLEVSRTNWSVRSLAGNIIPTTYNTETLPGPNPTFNPHKIPLYLIYPKGQFVAFDTKFYSVDSPMSVECSDDSLLKLFVSYDNQWDPTNI